MRKLSQYQFVLFCYFYFCYLCFLCFCFSSFFDLSKISIGDAIVPYHENFKLFIVCKHPAPRFSPELCAKVNIINFGVTQYGLEDELLSIGTTLLPTPFYNFHYLILLYIFGF